MISLAYFLESDKKGYAKKYWKSVHKFLGILVRNKKYANSLIIGRHGDGAFSF